jgi:hypothetical protein
VSGQLYAPATLPSGKEHPVPIRQEAGWEPEPVWTWCRIEKFLAPTRNRTPILYRILLEFGIPKKLVRLIKMCLNETYSEVHVGKICLVHFLLKMA